MIEEAEPLSARGERRREEILAIARSTARRRRHRRQITSAASALVALIGGVGIVYRLRPPTRMMEDSHPIAIQTLPPPPVIVQAAGVSIARIETDNTITARLAITSTPPRWHAVGDDELLRELADAGRPAGLVRMNGQAILLSQ